MTTSFPTLPIVPGPTRRRRGGVALVVALAVVLGGVLASSCITLNDYVLVPGQAQSVSQVISVPAGKGHPLHGRILLTDVGVVTDVKAIDWIRYTFNSDDEILPEEDLTCNLPLSEFDAEGTVDMTESQLTAEAVSLRQLGYPVAERDVGVTVYVLDPGSPAYRALSVGDVITSLDGTPTTNPVALSAAITAHQPGQRVTLRVGSIADPLPGTAVSVTLSSIVESGKRHAFLGIGTPQECFEPMGTQPEYTLPFPVGISTKNIGGPSAGLAFTLGILDSLSGGELTGGRVVAATGTIRPDGTVGDVGGVAQKTVAVERAGASLFLVPQVELSTARAHADRTLTVLGVTSLQQALQDLARYGGHLGAAATGPPSGPAGHSVPADWQQSPWT